MGSTTWTFRAFWHAVKRRLRGIRGWGRRLLPSSQPRVRVYLPQAHFGNDPRTRTAVHEAGHALLAWSSACVTTVTAATITADDDESSAGHVSFVTRDDAWSGFIPTHTFEVTGRAADIFDACYRRALTVVLAYRHRLDALASALEKKRRVDAAEIETLLGPRTSRMFR